MPRCRSNFCITDSKGLKGREFEPPANAQGLSSIWCEPCIKIGTQMQFFSKQTADMIRSKWTDYDGTNLPKDVKLFLRQYSTELLKELGEEL